MNKVEAYFIFPSAAAKQKIFDEIKADETYSQIVDIIPFVSLNETHLFYKNDGGYPYSTITLMEGYFSWLTQYSYWGQYFLESSELEIDVAQTKTGMARGLQIIDPHQDYENVSGFTSYFTPVPGWKKFSGPNGTFLIELRTREINGKNCFWFDGPLRSEFFPWIFDFVFLHIDGNKIYSLMDFLGSSLNVPNDFSSGVYIMEMFANSVAEFNCMSYNPSEESGWRTTKFIGIEENVQLNGKNFENCLLLEHDYIHVNCYHYDKQNQHGFQNYLCKDRVSHSWWQKDKGLIAVSLTLDGVQHIYTSSDITGTEAAETQRRLLERKDTPLTTPSVAPKEGKSFWKKLFGG